MSETFQCNFCYHWSIGFSMNIFIKFRSPDEKYTFHSDVNTDHEITLKTFKK